MTDRDKLCLKCSLPDCLPAHPGCLLMPKKKNPEKGGEEKIHLPEPWGLEETAARLGCKSTDWLRKEIRKLKRGQPASIPRFFTVGNRYHWDPPDVEAWLAARKQGGSV